MASNDNNNGKEKKEVMQSNLPLLFANGSPISLESMNLMELQGFFLFLLKCECGRPIQGLTDIDQPSWWPSEVSFENDLLKKTSKKGMWSSIMRKLIQKCYLHHKSGFLLEFSRKLMVAAQDTNKIKVIDNGDGTRSMRSAVTHKLLVTFRSENQDYDIKQRQQHNSFSTQSPLKKRCSLSLGINASDPRLPICEDLYLCDNCGGSFPSLQQVLVHEKTCKEGSENKQADEYQGRFFSYFKLKPRTHSSSTPITDSSSSSKVVRPRPSTYAKFLSIDVSSPLGQYIYSLSSANSRDTIDISSLCTAERKSALRSGIPSNKSDEIISSRSVFFPHLYKGGHGKEFPVTFKSPKPRKGKEDTHTYCFNHHQTAVRQFTLRHGLTPQSMKLYKNLRKRRLKVTLNKIDVNNLQEVVREWMESRREVKRKANMKLLKEQARHFEPYMPKLTSTYQISKQSSVSVLQSFTSAVQQLCSPEKKIKNGYKRVAHEAKRPVLSSRKKTRPVQESIVDLCSSTDEEEDDQEENEEIVTTNWR